MSRPDRKSKPRASAPARDTAPRKWMRGWGVGWVATHYGYGDGLHVTSRDNTWEIVPYVTGPGGLVAGYAIVRDGRRSGFTRVPGAIDLAVAIAELEITEGG